MPIRQFQAQRMIAPRQFQPIKNEPVVVEIGAGKGKHALQFVQQFPETTLYAIERTREKFDAMLKQAKSMSNDHFYPIHADALPWITHALYPKQVTTFYILYPNPEPHNPAQRWLNMPFFEFLLSRLVEGGQIILASNLAEYISEAEQQLLHVWHLPYQKQIIDTHSARTHFEVKYLARGEQCQQLVITKPEYYQTRFDDFSPLNGINA
ncbi:DUF938 domain-containing protein [Acinetobacter sp. B5B]|uniref:DUF938 domain-containing protein n=1 Tax=Acinetobacter baretiae TaxID=2605383 RepID=UPI0018C25765|nr:DUF938 domain-containing protein [Acinetobacter baretiae]MBF7682289.1 DUF938 domain-containing protein [Acinetobacter baretiae]MBF7685117.1 DUF938 domain-containing protein [Acinetobacter baretiae]